MGILKPHIHIFCMEQKKRPVIHGEVLTLGQQAVYATLQDVRSILGSYDIRAKSLPEGFDTANKIPEWKNGHPFQGNTNAQSLLTLLGADNVYAADVSAYQNPDFLIDLNVPVKDSYHERFDTIVDVGTLEHCFDISTALENVVKMLRGGGNAFIISPCSNAIDHGFYSFSPTLFYDYFGQNGFSNISCYLMEGSPYIYGTKGRLFKYERVGKECPLVSGKGVGVAFLATKDKNYSPQEIVKPIQGIYSSSKSWNAGVATASVDKHTLRHRIKRLLLLFLIHTKNYWPFFLQKLIFSRTRSTNLKYLGKY